MAINNEGAVKKNDQFLMTNFIDQIIHPLIIRSVNSHNKHYFRM